MLLVLRSKELGLPFERMARQGAGRRARRRRVGALSDDCRRHPARSAERRALHPVRDRHAQPTRLGAGVARGAARPVRRRSCSAAISIWRSCARSAGSTRTPRATPVSSIRSPVCRSISTQSASAMPPRRRGCRPCATANPEFVDADYALGRYPAGGPVERRSGRRAPPARRRRSRRSRARRRWRCGSATPIAAGRNGRPHSRPTMPRSRCRPNIPTRSSDVRWRCRSSGARRRRSPRRPRVIDGGQWMVGEAYYWRAWNQLRLGNLPMAREDADRALTQMANARVFVLSGVIEWRMRRLENAERDFQRAVTIDFGECEGAFDLGIVRDELRQVAPSRWPRSVRRDSATICRSSCAARRSPRSRPARARPLARSRDAARHQRALQELEERRDEIARAIERSKRWRRSTSRWRRARQAHGESGAVRLFGLHDDEASHGPHAVLDDDVADRRRESSLDSSCAG